MISVACVVHFKVAMVRGLQSRLRTPRAAFVALLDATDQCSLGSTEFPANFAHKTTDGKLNFALDRVALLRYGHLRI